MSNKETLQTNNGILTSNNDELDAIMATIGNLPSAVTKPDTYTRGNLMAFNTNGNAVDSGLSFNVVDGILTITYDDGL